MKRVIGARNDGRASFLFDIVDKKTGETFQEQKTGTSRLNAWTELEKEKGNVWEIKWA